MANRYNSYGHLHEVIDSAGTRVWKADDADALGNLKQFTLGNGTVTNQTYDTNNNRIASIRAVKGALVIQDQSYEFDALGNLSSREDHKNSITQSFCYDGLNRLKAARFNGCSSANNDYVYDPLGNLTTKDGISGALGYGTNGTNVAGPHAVTSANGWTYKYDAIGNLESATKAGEQTRTVQYSPFNTPTSITQGSKFSTVVYGPNQDRVQHSDSNGRVTTYVGGIYEEVTRNGETQKIHYVGDMALFISKGANTNATYGYEYLHRDHIGSLVALSKGTINSALDVQWQANGTWGERRYQQWNGPLDNALIPASTARGFTDHEHLDSVGLIHMNGRVYDPELGRFLSADPFVQSPYNTQSYNRYSYVFNNPLSFTDPSGYQTCGSPGPDVAPGGVTLPCGADTSPGSDAWYWAQYQQQQEQQKQQYENGLQYVMAKLDRWWISYIHQNYVNNMDPACQKSISKACDGPKWTSEDADNLTRLTVAGLGGGVGKLQLADPKRLVLESYKVSNALRRAEAARDATAGDLRRKHATYIGGHKDGKVVSGCSSNPNGCAEEDVARQLGMDAEMTGAKGFRRNKVTGDLEYVDIPVCTSCQSRFGKNQFPLDVKYDPGGVWSQ